MKTFQITTINLVVTVLVCVCLVANQAVALSVIDSGTSDPCDPCTGQEFYRTDRNIHKVYDGSQWVEQDLAVFNVKAYGAKGDGTTNDTNSINAALSAVPAAGGKVYFPAGSYLISFPLSVPSNCAVIGEGWQSKLVAPANEADFAFFVNSDIESGNTNLRFANIHIVGNRVNNTTWDPNQCFGIHLRQSSDIIIENVFVEEIARDVGIALRDCNDFVIRNCLLKNIHNTAIYVDANTAGNSDGVITGNIVQKTYLGNGIFLAEGFHDITISDNQITDTADCGIEVGATPKSGLSNRYVTVSGNVLDHCGDGILLRNADFINCTGNNCSYGAANGIALWPDSITAIHNNIIGNVCHDNNDHGIKIAHNARQTVVSGNNCYHNVESGIWSEGDQQDLLITSNVCSDNNDHGITYAGNNAGGFLGENLVISNNICRDNDLYGISVWNGLDVAITGNNCHDTRVGGAKHQQYGIITGDSSDYAVIVGNSCRGNLTGGITASGANNEIDHNIQ
ncbi:MAG: right-handed parallel beta-helix repeat-containing protein [Planctomycetota bacterium]